MSTSSRWPVWDTGRPRDLVAYVSIPAVVAADLHASRRLATPNRQVARDVTAEVYQRFHSRRIPYAKERWLPGDRQHVRSPSEMIQSGGTCVDLAVAFAAVCAQADLRPLLALMRRGEQRHALVVIDLDATLTDGAIEQTDPLRPDGAEKGVYRLNRRAAGQERLLAVDVARAAADNGVQGDFEEALRSGEAWLRQSETLHLVDIKHARSAGGVDELPSPEPEFWPPIHSRLVAPVGSYHAYQSRAPLEDSLVQAQGRAVIHGESGFGKSMLAYRAAAGAEHGYGWFLNASDKTTLQSSLAQAELGERPGGDSDFELTAFADAALARLHATAAPWVVILDNADCAPSSLDRFIPRPGPGQTVIITTTDRRWLDGDAATGTPDWARGAPVLQIRLDPLDPLEVPAGLPEWVRALLAGSPLLITALDRALAQGGVAGPQRDVEPVELVWETAYRLLDRFPAAREAALMLAWAPAEGLADEHFAAVGIDGEDVQRVVETGLAGRDGRGRVQMHRLLRRHVWASGGEFSDAAATRMLREEGLHRVMFEAADGGLLKELEQRLPADAQARSWLGLGRILEYRGQVQAAGQRFTRALEAHEAHPELSAAERADCLQGRARAVFQDTNATPADFTAAFSWLRQLRTGLDASVQQDRLRILRADALDALLRRRQASSKIAKDPAGAKQELLQVRSDLESSLHQRIALLQDMGWEHLDDEDRGIFNLASVETPLGKCSTGSEARKHFAAARELYGKAHAIRLRRYGNLAIPHIASCIHGQAVADYNEALAVLSAAPQGVPLPAETTEQIVGLLRQASELGNRALVDRQTFEGAADGSDTKKSLHFLAKVLLLRLAFAAGATDPASGESVEATGKAVLEYAVELAAARGQRA